MMHQLKIGGITAAMLLGATQAHAGSITQALQFIANAENSVSQQLSFDFNDDSLGNFLNANGEKVAPTLANFQAGGSIEGVFEIGAINAGSTSVNVASGVNVAPFEIVGDYSLSFTTADILGVTPIGVSTFVVVSFDALFNIFEDSSPDVTITATNFSGTIGDTDGGSLFASLKSDDYQFLAQFNTATGAFISANLLQPNQALGITGGTILSDLLITSPTVIAVETGVTPTTGNNFSFQDTAVFQVTAAVVPTPAAAAPGLAVIGFLAAMRWKRTIL